MDLGHLDKALLLGDETEVAVPPSLLASDGVLDLSFHPTLPILAAGLVNGEVEIFEYKGNEIVKRPLQNDFSSWIFAPNASYEADDIVLNHHHNNMRMHPKGGAGAVEFTDDGTYLVSASSDRSISVMDCVSARLVIHIPSDASKKLSAAKKRINESNKKSVVPFKRKAAASRKATASTRQAVVAGVTVNPHKYGISALNICDENLIATGDDDGLIAIWDMRTRQPAHTYHEHGDYVTQLCYFTDVQELVSSSGDTCLGVYDMRAGKIRDYSEKRNDELTCFTFINSTGINSASFIPSIICGTPGGTLPLWKYGSWARPYDQMESHPRDCDALVSFHGDDTTFNHNVILTGAGDGLVRVVQMYPLRRNLCQLSARDYSYSQANSFGIGAGGVQQHHNSNYIVKKKRGQEGISRMRVSADSSMLAVSGADNIIDFVDIRFLSDAKELDALRNKAERRHMQTIRAMESERAVQDEKERLLQAQFVEAEARKEAQRREKESTTTASTPRTAPQKEMAVAEARSGDDDSDSSDGTVSTSSDENAAQQANVSANPRRNIPPDQNPLGESREARAARIRAIILARGGVQKRRKQSSSSESSSSSDDDDSSGDTEMDSDEKAMMSDSSEEAKHARDRTKRKKAVATSETAKPDKHTRTREAKKKPEPANKVARTETPMSAEPASGEAGTDATTEPPKDPMQAYEESRQERRERVAAAKWLKNEKRKKVNFTFEKRRRRVNGFFADMFSGAGPE